MEISVAQVLFVLGFAVLVYFGAKIVKKSKDKPNYRK